MSKKKKRNSGRNSHGLFQVVWRTDLEVYLERTQNNYVELLDIYLRRMPYLNTLFDEVVSLQGSCKNNSLPGSHGKKLQLVAILSLRVKKSFLTIKECAICRSLVKLIAELHAHASRACGRSPIVPRDRPSTLQENQCLLSHFLTSFGSPREN